MMNLFKSKKDLFEFKHGDKTWYLTSAAKAVEHNGNTYLPLVSGRGDITDEDIDDFYETSQEEFEQSHYKIINNLYTDDNFNEFKKLNVDNIFGLSTQNTEYQKEMVKRLNLLYQVLSDEKLEFTN